MTALWFLRSGAFIATRPWLWATALRQVARLARPGWWHRLPLLPLPDAAWWAFRMETAYGDPAALPPTRDLGAYLEWCRGEDRMSR